MIDKLDEMKKLFDKITDHTSEILFGILSGTGLVLITIALITFITRIIPALQSYFLIMYTILYLFILISTSILYAKGWFKVIYLVSSLILSFVYIYTEIFGTMW